MLTLRGVLQENPAHSTSSLSTAFSLEGKGCILPQVAHPLAKPFILLQQCHRKPLKAVPNNVMPAASGFAYHTSFFHERKVT
jgi:hypothetical protein